MSLFEDLDLDLDAIPFLSRLSASMSAESCSGDVADECRDDAAAFRMKMAAVVAILIAGVIGVAIPLAGKKRRFLRADGGPFVLAKAFAAGVILATGFVHMLRDAQSALTDPCLSKNPWKTFPFSGFVAMLAALLTLVVDFVGTQFYERKHNEEEAGVRRDAAAVATAGVEEEEEIMVVPVMDDVGHGNDDGCGKMHIVGMHAHGHAHGHGHEHGNMGAEVDDGHVSSHVRHVVVSQVPSTSL